MHAELSGKGSALTSMGIGHGAAMGIGIRKRRRTCLAELAKAAWPAPGATLDLDFVNNQGYIFGRGIASALSLLEFSRGGSSETYTNALGVLVTSAANEPVTTFDPVTLLGKGMPVFEQRTNAIFNSVTNGSSASSTTGTLYGPDGILATAVLPTAGAVAFPGSGHAGTQAFSNSQTVGQSTDYAYSGYFASSGALNYMPYIVILAGNAVGTTDQLYCLLTLDCATGTLSGKSYSTGFTEVVAPTAVLQPSGMYKVEWVVRFTQQALLRTGVGAYVQIKDQTGASSFTATGTSGIQRACCMLETASNVGPYIPTTTAQVTRSADSALLTGNNFRSWYNQTEGTFVIEIVYTGVLSAAAAAVCSIVADDTTTGTQNSINIRVVSDPTNPQADVTIRSSNVSRLDSSGISPVVAGTTYKRALGYKVGSTSHYVNGVADVIDDVTAALPIVDRLILGQAKNFYLRRLTYYPVRAVNNQLKPLST